MATLLNQFTGYKEIETLKKGVSDSETKLAKARLAARAAKKLYEETVDRRSKSQRLVNELLQRKSGWTDSDVIQFTKLVKEDHSYEQAEARSKDDVLATEDAVEKEFNEFMRAILARYHEEQIWSDKIRSASTYGSLTVLSLNVIIFVLAILIVEPWRRQRLVQVFEQSLKETSDSNQLTISNNLQAIAMELASYKETLSTAQANPTASSFSDDYGGESRNIDPFKEFYKGLETSAKYQACGVVLGCVAGAATIGWILGSRYG